MANTMIVDTKWYTEKDGANDIEFIRAHEDLTPRGRIHSPISSAEILTRFRDKAKTLGMELVNEKCGLLKRTDDGKGGNRFMYIAEVKNEARPDYALSVGFRNFSDKSLAFQGAIATHIMMCKNGCCTGVIKPSKMRHTIGNVGNEGLLDSKIDTIFSRFLEDKDIVHNQIETMKGTKLTDAIVGKFVRKMVNNPYMGSANIIRVLEDLENPTLNAHDDNSVFRLHNACTYVTTHKLKNPSQAMDASRFCNNLIMSLIKDDFVPVGDVIDVDEADVEVLA